MAKYTFYTTLTRTSTQFTGSEPEILPGTTRYECQADIRESYVTERGSLLVIAYNVTQVNLTSVGGHADGWIYDGLVFEIDIKTQNSLFSWSAAAHVPINMTKLPLDDAGSAAVPFDFFHINSIQPVGDGYLVNSRHLWTMFLLDSKGQIRWQFEVSILFCQQIVYN